MSDNPNLLDENPYELTDEEYQAEIDRAEYEEAFAYDEMVDRAISFGEEL